MTLPTHALARLIADCIEKAAAEHRRLYPAEQYRDANIALGGLRIVAAAVLPRTEGMGNAETVAALRAFADEVMP